MTLTTRRVALLGAVAASAVILWTRLGEPSGEPARTVPVSPHPGDETTTEPLAQLLYTDYVYYQRAGEADWYTAVPTAIRNISGQPLEIISIEITERENLEIAEVHLLAPSAPSLTGNVYPRWPPVMPTTAIPVENFRPRAVDGTTIPPDGRYVGGSPTTPTADGHNLANDRVNDAPIALRIRVKDQSRTGRALGLSVKYKVNGREHHLTVPEVEFGICSERDFAAVDCQK